MKVYYANCRLGGKTSLLAGPFPTPNQAEAALDIVGPLAVKDEPLTQSASFGVMQCNAPGQGLGRYNSIVPPELFSIS